MMTLNDGSEAVALSFGAHNMLQEESDVSPRGVSDGLAKRLESGFAMNADQCSLWVVKKQLNSP